MSENGSGHALAGTETMKLLCFDAAINGEYTLFKLKERYEDNICLFDGTDDANIWDSAPWLFRLTTSFHQLKQDKLIKLEHLIILESKLSLKEACRFFQSLIYQQDESDEPVYYRIWDSRVWENDFLSKEPSELKEFFKAFRKVFTGNPSPEVFTAYEFRNDKVVSTKMEAGLLFDQLAEEVPVSPDTYSNSGGNEKTPAPSVDKPKRTIFYLD